MPFTNLHQPLNSCNGCNYPRKKLFNGTNYGSYRTQICLVSCSISTCFIKGKTSYGRHYHKFSSWRANISTILNNATAQYFPVATHADDIKQFKFNKFKFINFHPQIMASAKSICISPVSNFLVTFLNKLPVRYRWYLTSSF